MPTVMQSYGNTTTGSVKPHLGEINDTHNLHIPTGSTVCGRIHVPDNPIPQ